MTSTFSCTACGDAGKACCDTTSAAGAAKQACNDGSSCDQSTHLCPVKAPGWAGDPCGTGGTCNGKLSCNPTTKVCECVEAANWTTCTSDGSKVCAPGGGGGGIPQPDDPNKKYTQACTGTQGNGCGPNQFACWNKDGDKPICANNDPAQIKTLENDAKCKQFCWNAAS